MNVVFFLESFSLFLFIDIKSFPVSFYFLEGFFFSFVLFWLLHINLRGLFDCKVILVERH